MALEAALTPTGGGLGTGGGAPAATPTPTPSPTPSFDDFGTGIAHYPDQAKPKLGDGPELKAGEPKPGEVAPLGKERAEAAEPSDPPNPSDPEVDELDVLAESLGLKPLSKEDKVEPETPVSLADLDTPEKLTKAINPDGKASEKQQLENLQRLIGRQSSEVKTARQVAQFAHTYAPFMRQAANGQTVMDVVKLSQALPPEVLQAQLDEAGVVLVPRDYLANASQYADYPPDVVDAVIADRDIPYGDKVAQIEQDPKLAAKAEALKLQRQSSIAQQRQAQTSQMLQTLDQLGQKFEGLFKELSAPDPATGQSVFQRFNSVLPPQLGGAERATMLFLSAAGYHSLQPGTMRKTTAALKAHFEKQFAKKMRAPQPGGAAHGSPTDLIPQVTEDQSSWGVR